MTGPKKRIAFVQHGLQFDPDTGRDDLDQRSTFYEVFDNGTVEMIPAFAEGREGDRQYRKPGGLERGAAHLLGAFDLGLFESDPFELMTSDKAGPTQKGADTPWEVRNHDGRVIDSGLSVGKPLTAKVKGQMADHLQKKYNIEVPLVDLWQWWYWTQEIEEGLHGGGSFEDAWEREYGQSWSDALKEHGLGADSIDDATATESGTTTGSGIGNIDPTGQEDVEAGFNATGSGTYAGTAAGGVVAEVAGNLPAGPGPDGVNVTPELLQEFVDSDYNLAFGAMLNEQRTAGGAAIFMTWLTDQFFRFRSEHMGEVAAQAMEGNVPKGNFTGFLRRKGLLSGDSTEGDNTVSAQFGKFQTAQTVKTEEADSEFIDVLETGEPAKPVPEAIGEV